MVLTRRTQRFGELASAVEDQLAEHGLEIDPDVVDHILRNRIDAGAEVMRVTTRTALGYAPANLPTILADTILEAAQSMPERMPCGRPGPALRVVR